MESILVTPETIAQYRKDCRADRLAAKSEQAKPAEIIFGHDRFMVGKTVFVPKSLLSYRFPKDELHAIAF